MASETMQDCQLPPILPQEVTLIIRSVVPEWFSTLTMQQQSVLLLASRGPDGVGKDHPCKRLVRVYRGTVFLAARYGRLLSLNYTDGEGDTFMDRRSLSDPIEWQGVVRDFLEVHDTLPHHYLMHLIHGIEILGYKTPDPGERRRWAVLYELFCDVLHMNPETEEQMDRRLGDWGRKEWK